MTTKSVDANLESFLNKPLDTSGDRSDNIIDGDLNENEDEDNDNIPITRSTKEQIIMHFTNSLTKDPRMAEKIMGLLSHLKGVSEKDAKEYLNALRISDIASISSQSVTLLLKCACHYFVNPMNKKAKKNIITDPHIRASLTNSLARVHAMLGNISGAVLFVLYSIDSYSPDILNNIPDDDEHDENKQEGESNDRNQETNISSASV